MKRRTHEWPGLRSRALGAVLAAVVVGSVGCGDDPFLVRWELNPDTVLLYSLARPELNLRSGYSVINRRAVTVEAPAATGSWDVAVDTRDGQIVLLPPSALGVDSKARITTMSGMTFDDVIEAPADTLVYTNEPVPMVVGTVYVVRSGQYIGSFGTRCVNYAKLEPLIVDPELGTLTFLFDRSPVCNDRKLIPPE